MRALHRSFVSFSQVIGFKDWAVWFDKSSAQSGPSGAHRFLAASAADHDAVRAADYCAHDGLKAQESPHVEVTTSHPGTAATRGNYHAIAPGGPTFEDPIALPGKLSDRIRSSDLRDLEAKELGSGRCWRRWAQVLSDSAKAMGKVVNLIRISVDVKAFKIEFDAGRLSTQWLSSP
jgi:hypothetical protein